MLPQRLSYPTDMSKCMITQGFGANPAIYSNFKDKNGNSLNLKGHNGLDIGSYGQANVPITTIDDGEVILVIYDQTGFGWRVDVQHSWGRSLYAHMLLQPIVNKGQKVKTGDRLGIMGSTGNSTGVHLHLGVYPTGEPVGNGYNGAVDPLPLLARSPILPPVDAPPTSPVTPIKAGLCLTKASSGLAARLTPDRIGAPIGYIPYDTRVEVTDKTITLADGTIFRQALFWIAEKADGVQLLKQTT